MELITNRNNDEKNDRFGFYLSQAAKKTNVYIAVAFFTNNNFIEKALQNDCAVKLIVRLSKATSPKALRKIINLPNIEIRYYTSNHFHPKLYIFENDCAFIGSSNLTESALGINSEVNVKIEEENEEPFFQQLYGLFQEYWEQAIPLTLKDLSIFENIVDSNPDAGNDLFGKIKDALGEKNFNNFENKNKINQKSLFIDNFKRLYINYINNFKRLTEYYTVTDERRWNDIPLRIELDRFLWWIREYKCPGETYRNDKPITNQEILKNQIISLKKEFIVCEHKYLEEAYKNFTYIQEGFSSVEKINSADMDELFDILKNVHAFHDLFRFHIGGLEGLKSDFKKNDIKTIKKCLIHLIFDKEDYMERIYDCINLDEYKIQFQCFGENCAKELYGYVNNDNIPTCNGRTKKSMEWLGLK